ncbi:MAG: radical SAM family heme chaperone HemW [Verrucomicrobiae bacterium]|nr:radical SAM family heme chaperone HemW [Verrucomicrobiae bacterium]
MESLQHLYIHIPFCPRICPYCSFYVQPANRRLMPSLIDAILQEFDYYKKKYPLRIKTIFLGGGTPSALPTSELERLISVLTKHFAPTEFTLEMNPTTVSSEKAKILYELGINRVSLGAQSFDPNVLATLGRQHSPEKIIRSYEILHETGFPNLNIDLMFAVPGQSIESWQKTLEKTLSLQPEHISTYCLTYEEDTPFFEKIQKGQWQRNLEVETEFYLTSILTLEKAGFQHYEISNFAKPGKISEHNFAYWRGSNFIGLGPSAVSTVENQRWQNISDLTLYLQGAQKNQWQKTNQETLSDELREKEKIIFGLRTNEGAAINPKFFDSFQQLISAGYAQETKGRWILTQEGKLRADAIGEFFL